LVAFNMLAQRVAQPVLRLAQLWQDFQQTRLSIHRLGDIMNNPPEPSGQSSSTPALVRGDIRFERVRFRYGAEQAWALDDLTFHIPAGEMIGIAGTSGSGKSTILRLLQRLHMPDSGRILLDGNDLTQLDPGWLRRQIGVVLQESCLYNRSVRANIALARPSASFDEIVRASRLAGAEEFILRLPQGYDTMVEERGANLSGGQRQRLAIARALLTEPRILVLDEATSALDAESEEIVRHNLRAIAHGRTVIIVAHRLSALRDCRRIITLETGRIVECGSHLELVRAGGRYADLYRRQMSAVETAA
jgi:ATP-binding cassette, subfamily B, bacterial HlyB/CyaB